jgi:hypothetical protein
MNETEQIKVALVEECVNQFILAVVNIDEYESLTQRDEDIKTWSQAVLAALAIQDKVSFINKPI